MAEFSVHETLVLRSPHLKGTDHEEVRVNYRGRLNVDESVVSPLPGEGCMDFTVKTENLSREVLLR